MSLNNKRYILDVRRDRVQRQDVLHMQVQHHNKDKENRSKNTKENYALGSYSQGDAVRLRTRALTLQYTRHIKANIKTK